MTKQMMDNWKPKGAENAREVMMRQHANILPKPFIPEPEEPKTEETKDIIETDDTIIVDTGPGMLDVDMSDIEDDTEGNQ